MDAVKIKATLKKALWLVESGTEDGVSCALWEECWIGSFESFHKWFLEQLGITEEEFTDIMRD